MFARGRPPVIVGSMSSAPIRYFHRYRQTVETEQIFGEGWIRFAYQNPAGRFLVWLLIRRAIFSWWYGRKMNQRTSALRILPFIAKYEIDADDFKKSPFAFKTFNEFFYRGLRPGARPIAPGAKVAVLPADGRHLAFPSLDAAAGVYVKGARLPLPRLLGNPQLADDFSGGAMLVSRLCPVDYHRFHFPVGGQPGEARRIDGWLYSVSPVALRRNVEYLLANKREVTLIESPVFGPVAMIEVGATNVGRICQSFVPGRPVEKGDEKGFFAFGGSCVITLFQRGRIRFDGDIVAQSGRFVETFARMGDRLGEAD